MKAKTFLFSAFCLYLPIKIIVVVLLINILPDVFGRTYFAYMDPLTNSLKAGDTAVYVTCNLRSPNGLFSGLLCVMDIKRIDTLLPILLSFALNSIKDIGFIYLASQIVSRKPLIIFVLLMALHPYMGLYHARLDTMVFACLAVLLLYIRILQNQKIALHWDIIFILLTGFRNGAAIMFIAFYLYEIFRNVRSRSLSSQASWIKPMLIALVSLVAVFTVSQIPEENYAISFWESSKNYPLNMTYFLSFVETPVTILNYIISGLLIFISHLLLLLGFREGAFTHFGTYFFPFDLEAQFAVFIGTILVILHGFGFYNFFKHYLKIDMRHLCYFALVVPSFLLVAHMRYLLPLMPLALLGVVIYIDRTLAQD